jgi:hypothetical protein
MSGGRDEDTPFQVEADAAAGVDPAGAAEQGVPLVGWYYFGPEPPWVNPAAHIWQAAPNGSGYGQASWSGGYHGAVGGGAAHKSSDDSADLKEAFDRLSRGDLSADTIGKLLNLKDRDFWTGALVGAAGALLATNLPMLVNLISGKARAKAGADASNEPSKSDSNTSEERK